jgi:lon-related putative ATP-dependent protease
MAKKMNQVEPLASEALRHGCDPSTLGFETTDDLPKLEEVIGQPRAFRALEFGTEVSGPGFNIFVMGHPGSGKTTLIQQYLQRKAEDEPVPDDWCYVNNFANPHEPKALQLPPGRAIELKQDMEDLIERGREEIAKAFESSEYRSEQGRLSDRQEEAIETELNGLRDKAEKDGFVLGRTPFGFVVVPAEEGEPLKPEQIEQLTVEERTKLEEVDTNLQKDLKASLQSIRDQDRITREEVRKLDRRTALFAVEHLFDIILANYHGLESVWEYLEAVKQDMVDNVDQLRGPDESEPPGLPMADIASRYEVNVIVDHSDHPCAPVVVENQPTYQNLLGRIEHQVVMGASRTDFSMIQAGALHRANGGYLILPVRDVLVNPYTWDGLKHALREQSIRIISMGAQVGLISTVSLEPEPIPLDVKVVLIGTPSLYYSLSALDEDYAKLFKIRAEFATVMDRNEETEQEYALFVRSVVDANKLPPFDASAVARVIEYSSRLADEQAKLSARFGKVADLIRESAYWARKSRKRVVGAKAVEKAIEESIYRSNIVEERLQEMVEDGTLLMDVKGKQVGQVNALSVFLMGDYAFGRPTRVTATVHAGQDGVVDIEREAKLGGPIHTKGVLIIGGILGEKYGQRASLSLSAALTFEQSYEGVEGDSASAAELFALTSALSKVPLRQDLAITGSVNQHGQIQAIGGVNEKIEGFFRTCKVLGLTGNQGVLIPAANVQHLMLNEEVIKAVEKERFHIWPIATIDEGLELLTGVEPGQPDAAGGFPEGSIHFKASETLKTFTEVVKESSSESDSESDNGGKGS